MTTTIGTFTVQPGKMDEAIRLWKQAVQSAKNAKGFKGARLLTDASSNKCAIVADWESDAEAQAFATSGTLQQAMAPMQPLMASPLVREVYQVSASA